MRKTACCLLLALLQFATPSSAEDFLWPGNVSVAVGKTAEFRCGGPSNLPADSLIFDYKGAKGNFSLKCPSNQIVEILQHLKGSCVLEDGKVFAVWDVKYTYTEDNMTSVVCSSNNVGGFHFAFLQLFDNSSRFGVLVGSTIGGFFAAMVLAIGAYYLLKRSETVQQCYRGKQKESEEDDGVDEMEMN